MIPPSEATMIRALREEADRLQKQATSIEFDAQELRYQADEIENRYKFNGPCIGCPKRKSCTLSGTTAALDRCQMARELAGAAP